MSRALFVWVICVSITVIAVALAHIGITFYGLWTRYHENEIAREWFGSILAASALPLFFLCFMVVCAACLFAWSVKRLFKSSATLPDFL